MLKINCKKCKGQPHRWSSRGFEDARSISATQITIQIRQVTHLAEDSHFVNSAGNRWVWRPQSGWGAQSSCLVSLQAEPAPQIWAGLDYYSFSQIQTEIWGPGRTLLLFMPWLKCLIIIWNCTCRNKNEWKIIICYNFKNLITTTDGN